MKDKKTVNIRDLIYIVISVIAGILLYSIIGCPIKALTGISCAGCGMTRALLAISKGHVKEAFDYHPLFWTVPVCGIIYLMKNKIPGRIKTLIIYVVIVMYMSVYIIRMIDPNCDVVTFDIKNGLIYRFCNMIVNHNQS